MIREDIDEENNAFHLAVTRTINFITITVQANEDQNKDLMKIVKAFMPSNSTLISPETNSSTQPIQLYDFNHDGQNEIIFTFEIKEKVQPSPSQFGAIVLKRDNADWRKIWEIKKKGIDSDFSGLEEITGDGTREYLFGVTNGADIGSELEVFQ
ncbi:TPR repeat-containing protein [Lysinibacillus fusiformis ZC1]|nr:TPR repeat-containing protein [Lysinibacillus fusiformis ZC1]